jgi:uncharacterized protein
MQAFVYRSARRAGTYVYLAERDGFARLPGALAESLGALEFVLELELAPERRLAREDPEQVRRNLAAQGWHLQLPPPPESAAAR